MLQKKYSTLNLVFHALKMEQLKLGKSEVYSSRIIYGCMRLNDKNLSSEQVNADSLIKRVFNYGVNHFDLADIYGNGECESIFSKVLRIIHHLETK